MHTNIRTVLIYIKSIYIQAVCLMHASIGVRFVGCDSRKTLFVLIMVHITFKTNNVTKSHPNAI